MKTNTKATKESVKNQDLEQQVAKLKQDNLEKFVAEINESCKKHKCKLIAQAIFTQNHGMEFKIIPVNE